MSLVTTHFCTGLDSSAVEACAKFCGDVHIVLKIIWKCIFTKFECIFEDFLYNRLLNIRDWLFLIGRTWYISRTYQVANLLDMVSTGCWWVSAKQNVTWWWLPVGQYEKISQAGSVESDIGDCVWAPVWAWDPGPKPGLHFDMIRWSLYCLIFIMWIPTLVKWHLYFEIAPHPQYTHAPHPTLPTPHPPIFKHRICGIFDEAQFHEPYHLTC